MMKGNGANDGKHQHQAGTGFNAEGARALSEALKTDTTLQTLDLGGEQEESGQDK